MATFEFTLHACTYSVNMFQQGGDCNHGSCCGKVSLHVTLSRESVMQSRNSDLFSLAVAVAGIPGIPGIPGFAGRKGGKGESPHTGACLAN